MKVLRRILGILVMIAGFLGLILSLVGLIGLWMFKPAAADYLTTTVGTLNSSISTSQKAMEVTGQALDATVMSVDALSVMLEATARSVEETGPVIEDVNTLLGESLPATLESATASLRSAQQAAVVLDSTIRSLEAFQATMVGVPWVGAFIETPAQTYNPETPLAESLGEVAVNLESMPAMFVEISEGMSETDDNLQTIQSSLNTMSQSARLISQSLGEYKAMVVQSQSSMEDLAPMLSNAQTNIPRFLDGIALGLSLFFFWLLAIQVVVFSQGWELYHGTAGRMEAAIVQPQAA